MYSKVSVCVCVHILTLQCGDALVLLHEVWHDLLQGALPLTRGPGTRAAVRPDTHTNTHKQRGKY